MLFSFCNSDNSNTWGKVDCTGSCVTHSVCKYQKMDHNSVSLYTIKRPHEYLLVENISVSFQVLICFVLLGSQATSDMHPQMSLHNAGLEPKW